MITHFGFIVSKCSRSRAIDFKTIDRRICVLRMRGKFKNCIFICAHAPMEERSERENNQFDEQLDRMYKICPSYDIKIILGGNIINYVKAQRLSWYGHIYRKPETSTVKKIHKWQPYITRPVGRLKHRWDDDVRNDLRKMKLLKWTEQAQDRHEWKKTVEKAKTLHEL